MDCTKVRPILPGHFTSNITESVDENNPIAITDWIGKEVVYLKVSVADQGIGMSEVELGHLFQRFVIPHNIDSFYLPNSC